MAANIQNWDDSERERTWQKGQCKWAQKDVDFWVLISSLLLMENLVHLIESTEDDHIANNNKTVLCY